MSNWETCSNRNECVYGNRFGKGCFEDNYNNAMGGLPWRECYCGIDENGLLHGTYQFDYDAEDFKLDGC